MTARKIRFTMQYMAKLIANLPPHCRVKRRKSYADIYFIVHKKDRPQGWKPTIHLGRTDKSTPKEILERANGVYEEYEAFKIKYETGVDISMRLGTFPALIQNYKETNFWLKLSPRTQQDYNVFLGKIVDWSSRAGHPHISQLKTSTIYKFIMSEWPDAVRRQKYARTIFINVYNQAIREGHVEHNLPEKIQLERVTRDEKKVINIWMQDNIDAFVKEADARGLHSLGSIVLTGIETAQRLADVMKMRNGVDYDNGKLVYVQQKTGKKVQFNTTDKLHRRYKKHPSRQMFMFINERTGEPWKYRTLAKYIREICEFIGLKGYVYAHLRHSQVYYLNELELSSNVISAITGHSIDTVESMLKNHYLEIRNETLANKGVAKINHARRLGGQKVDNLGGQND
jgi:site-specific recombinase XerD